MIQRGGTAQSVSQHSLSILESCKNWKFAKIATRQRTDNVEGLNEALVTQCGQHRGVEWVLVMPRGQYRGVEMTGWLSE